MNEFIDYCKNGNTLQLKQLYESNKQKIDIDMLETGLVYASYFGHLNIVKYLIHYIKYKATYECIYGRALKIACRGGQLCVVKYLIKLNINIVDFDNIFALACKEEQIQIAKYLISINNMIGVNKYIDIVRKKTIFGEILQFEYRIYANQTTKVHETTFTGALMTNKKKIKKAQIKNQNMIKYLASFREMDRQCKFKCC